MTDIYGRTSSDLSVLAVHPSSWVNKLRVRLDTAGLTKLPQTWKEKITPQGRQIYRLVVSARCTKDTDSIGLLPTPSGTSNHGKNHVAGRLDEWGGSSNPWRGTDLGKVHCPRFELWIMGFPDAWVEQMPREMQSSRRLRPKS